MLLKASGAVRPTSSGLSCVIGDIEQKPVNLLYPKKDLFFNSSHFVSVVKALTLSKC